MPLGTDSVRPNAGSLKVRGAGASAGGVSACGVGGARSWQAASAIPSRANSGRKILIAFTPWGGVAILSSRR
ncbi:MAG: hypothetical protein ABT19_14925 [Rhodanobacter sp. SCN 68-63]|nr:MAG: hypothetical protein ABT19_14925 [Rhodanobacter sp. SCN 68-63]